MKQSSKSTCIVSFVKSNLSKPLPPTKPTNMYIRLSEELHVNGFQNVKIQLTVQIVHRPHDVDVGSQGFQEHFQRYP